MSNYCFANQKIQPIENAGVPVSDLLVQRGYGIFDFLRVANNKAVFIEDHLDRFFNSASIMRLNIPQSREEIKNIVNELIAKNNMPYSGLRLVIAGGDAPDGYTIEKPHLIIIQAPLAKPTEGLPTSTLKLVTYNYQRQMPEVKTTDYLMAIWLQPWMKENGGDDILYHKEGWVSECPRSNFFMVTQDNVLVTPESNMLKGITRKNILKVAKLNGIALEERKINISEFTTAKEAFITSSTKRIIPVHQIDDILVKSDYSSSLAHKIYNLLVALESQ
jgi:D-alanine transaminase/branched-chain amino acid aminotransferase